MVMDEDAVAELTEEPIDQETLCGEQREAAVREAIQPLFLLMSRDGITRCTIERDGMKATISFSYPVTTEN